MFDLKPGKKYTTQIFKLKKREQMEKIKIDLNRLKTVSLNELRKEQQNKTQGRIYAEIDYPEFLQLISINAKRIMIKRGNKHDLNFTPEHLTVLKNLCDYLKGGGEYNPAKGILLLGINGTGKTLILLSFIHLIQEMSRKIINHYHSKEIPDVLEKLKTKVHSNLSSFYIEDIGKETKEIKTFGTITAPFSDLIDILYGNSYGWHFGCSNYSIEKSLEESYGKTITGRIKEMFNIVILTGKDLRQ